ncbi:hypothetical protein Tsubulata_050467 [Turnera subulata]|uniref:Acyl-[acyl-carrier-protein] hydrolase n=1 Tax=Turnera subulata TaxID=218843 RepID=A0A9Q0FP86_9ROSI|nr:hypothetical protein Tsubulata_050467 [Turnera subulata]
MNNHSTMTPVTTKVNNFHLHLAGNLHRKDMKNIEAMTIISRLEFPSFWKLNTPRKHRLYVVASAGNPRSLGITSGGKVNGISVGEITPFTDKKRIPPGLPTDDDYVGKPLRTDLIGRFVEDRLVYRQTFSIRSYEIGPDKTATMETLMNLLQETALNHVSSSGLAGNDFGATRKMSLRKLIWVVTRIHIQVQRYSSWGDVVEVDTWVDAAGKNGMRRDWIIRDCNTQEIITRATSTWVTMNRETRKLSKIPDQVREELVPFYLNRLAIPTENSDVAKIDKLTNETAEVVRSGLAPRWSDMDANQHVNNVKYIGWILESVPIEVLEDFSLTSMTLEYRRECRQSNLLESLTSRTRDTDNNSSKCRGCLKQTHLLQLQADKAEIVRARTEWRTKHK